MANCKIIYPSGEATQVTYNCVKNFDYGHEVGYLDTDDAGRSLDGSLNSYVGPRKKTFDLTFSYVLLAQLQAWQLAFEVGGPIDLYLDGSSLVPDAIVLITEPISAESEHAFPTPGVPTYTFSVRLEEV